MWLCSDSDLYLVEVTLAELRNLEEPRDNGSRKKQSFCLALPLILCEPPRDHPNMTFFLLTFYPPLLAFLSTKAILFISSSKLYKPTLSPILYGRHI